VLHVDYDVPRTLNTASASFLQPLRMVVLNEGIRINNVPDFLDFLL